MKHNIFILFSVLILGGCSAKNVLKQEAQYVRIYDDLPTNKKCQYLDEIIGSEGSMLSYLFISNYDLTMGARCALRNQAFELGGNTVVIQRSVFVYATSTVYVGQVYNCQ